jgi:hypothetical protein
MKLTLKLAVFVSVGQAFFLSSCAFAQKSFNDQRLVASLNQTQDIKVYSQAHDGGVNSGGGNGQVADFYDRSLQIASQILALSPEVLRQQNINPTRLSKIAQELKIEATSRNLFWNEASVEALNFPDKIKILFNSPAWEKKTSLEKNQLIVHEFLGLLELPDHQFKVSAIVASQITGQRESFKTLDCTTSLNGRVIDRGVKKLYQEWGEPEGSGRALVYHGENFRVMADTYPLEIYIQILLKGEVVDVVRASSFQTLTQFMTSQWQQNRQARLLEVYAATEFSVSCVELKK